MAVPLDKSAPPEEQKTKQVSDKDVEIAVRMTVQLLSQGKGLDVVKKALSESQDPAQVVGQFLSQIASKLAEKLQQEYNIDPAIFLAKNGWLEQILDYIEKKLDLPSDFSDEVYAQTLEVIKAAASGPTPEEQAQQAQMQPAPQAQPPVEQGAM